MTKTRAILLTAFVGVLACMLARWRNESDRQAAMSPRDRAYEQCRQCGLGDEEIGRLIRTMTASTRDRETLLKSFDDTFETGDDNRELCVPCVEAVLDAAGVKPSE